MPLIETTMQYFIGTLLLLSSLGVILLRNPVHASLSFLVALMTIAFFFLRLSAEFISIIQVLIYAGAILVIFIFALVLFQDAFQEISRYKSKVSAFSISIGILAVLIPFTYFLFHLKGVDYTTLPSEELPHLFGTVEGIGKALYIKFFFPFEAVVLLFLIALVGSLYLAKKEA